MGYAPEVWVSRPRTVLRRPWKTLGIHFVGEEDYAREVFDSSGRPGGCHPHPASDVVISIPSRRSPKPAREMRRNGKTKIIVVTSPQHTRRTKALWRTLVGRDSTMMVHPAPADPFDAAHWWRNTRDILSVVRETLGLVNVWAGLPAPPHAQ